LKEGSIIRNRIRLKKHCKHIQSDETKAQTYATPRMLTLISSKNITDILTIIIKTKDTYTQPKYKFQLMTIKLLDFIASFTDQLVLGLSSCQGNDS